MRWPWQRTPAPDPAAVAREAAREEVAAIIGSLDRAQTLAQQGLVMPAPGTEMLQPNLKNADRPLYHWDQPYTWAVQQPPRRRPGSLVTVDTLRTIADTYDVLRACIQHLKREVAAVPIKVVPRDKELQRVVLAYERACQWRDRISRSGVGSLSRAEEHLRRAGEALERAEQQQPETMKGLLAAQQWFDAPGGLGGHGCRRSHYESQILEDVCVIGAAAVYYSPARNGKPYESVPIDAATIRPRVDAYGWDPLDQERYEQWIYGTLVRKFTDEELRYDGLYPKSYSPYFWSPVEWLLTTVQSALKADEWNRNWLTDGNVPDLLIGAPVDWSPEQIKEYAAYFDALISNSADRHRAKIVPGGGTYTQQTRKDADFQEFELWLARRTGAIMGVQLASVGFAGEQYKTSQTDSMKSTSEFGAGALLEFRKASYDYDLERLGHGDLEVQDVTAEEEEAGGRADRLQKLVAGSVLTPNEARAEEGLDPVDGGDTLLVATTLQPLDLALKPPEPPAVPGSTPKAPGAVPDAKRGDLARWERKALARLKSGKPALCAFESETLDLETASEIREGLLRCETVEEVRGVFARADVELERGDSGAEGGGGIHWVTIDGHHVPITDKGIGTEHIRQATAKLDLGKPAYTALTQAHKEGRLITDAHLYRAIGHAQTLQLQGQSEGDAFAAAVQKHGIVPDIKPTKGGGIKVPGKAPLPFQAISDISDLYAAAKSGNREHIAQIKEEIGPTRVQEASVHAHQLRAAGLLDKAVDTHRAWIDEKGRELSDQWAADAKRESDEAGFTGRKLVQEAASQGRRLSFRDRATGRTHSYIEIADLPESDLEEIYRTIRTSGRESTKSGSERMFPVPGFNNGPIKMWTLHELVVSEKKIPASAVRLHRSADLDLEDVFGTA